MIRESGFVDEFLSFRRNYFEIIGPEDPTYLTEDSNWATIKYSSRTYYTIISREEMMITTLVRCIICIFFQI